MALQGTIETFALPDVMRLLASTKKTGRLRLSGSRGTGSIWVDDGRVVAGEASSSPHAHRSAEIVFELLRFEHGEFEFDSDHVAPDAGEPADAEALIAEAEAMLDEWRAIEAVVPSSAAWVTLRRDLPADEVSVDRVRWRLIASVGHGATVGELAEVLDLGEMDAARQVKGLADGGLADVAAEAPGDATGSRVAAAPTAILEELEETSDLEPVGHETEAVETEVVESEVVEPVVVEPVAGDTGGADRFDGRAAWFEADDHEDDDEADTVPPAAHGGNGSLPPPPPPMPTSVGAGVGADTDPSDAAEIARQLANLSPKAAKAVAAAAKATTQEERERALAEVDDTEDPINRELLIKFLGSVNG